MPPASPPAILNLRQALDRLEGGGVALLSLDLFETLLCRQVAQPADLFTVLGRRLAEDHPGLEPRAKNRNHLVVPDFSLRSALHLKSRADRAKSEALRDSHFARSALEPVWFATLRQQAQGRAQWVSAHTRGHAEVTLAEIYHHLPPSALPGNPTPTALAAAEWACERDLCRPNRELAPLLARAGELGIAVAVVSDTWHSADRLADLLAHHWPDLAPAFILASCDHGRSKAHGLLDLALRRAGVGPEEALHVGDDPRTDGAGAAASGIPFVSLATPGIDDLIASERRPDSHPDLGGGDGGLSLARRRAARDSAGDGWFHRHGATVLGPVVGPFLAWVAARLTALGVDRVGLLMREGRVLGRLAAPFLDSALRPVEVWVSRHAVGLAGLAPGDGDALWRYLNRYTPISGTQACQELGLEPPPADAPHLDQPLTPERLPEFIAFLLRPALNARVMARAEAARQALLAHLEPLLDGVAEGGTVALLDLGYNGTIQAGLQAALDQAGRRVRLHGLYLATTPEAARHQRRGGSYEGWLMNLGAGPDPMAWFLRGPEVLEIACLPADGVGSVRGHRADGTPILAESHLPAGQLAQMRAVQDGMAHFIRVWREMAGPDPTAPLDPALTDWSRAILKRLLLRPTAEEARHLGDWLNEENVGADHLHPLTEPPHLDRALLAALPAAGWLGLPARQVYWLFGCARRQRGAAFAERLAELTEGHPAPAETPLPPLTLTPIGPHGPLSDQPLAWTRESATDLLATVEVRFPEGLLGVVLGGFPVGSLIRVKGLLLRAGDWRHDLMDAAWLDSLRVSEGARLIAPGVALIDTADALLTLPTPPLARAQGAVLAHPWLAVLVADG
ncbi:HAD family hydrolase [Roseospirillum parvum]|uniref:FMN phosphatase YigB, HAD superfamily n=1 Tax=Roseospirillum parvum TaxID=83401 RepID=A0A1G7TWP6_9PROT|nr:HAD family hydrolase [Roseospirillum parvum]SDG39531.1 FMN phosphatase YigB, HAD superfamily [Roseospirillum parvum]